MSERELSADVSDELVAIVLEDVEEPNLRRVLERLIRNDKLQQACILKDMTLGRRADFLGERPIGLGSDDIQQRQ